MEWKDIKGYEGHYRISDNGDIFSLESNKVLKTMSNKNGYTYIHLTKGGKKKSFTIHRLVALHFCEGYGEDLVVDHIDQNRDNNHCSNLRWISRKENSNNISADTRAKVSEVSKRNARKVSQMTGRKKRPVISISPDGVEKYHGSIMEASRYTGVGNSSIWKALNKGSVLASGYKFKHALNG